MKIQHKKTIDLPEDVSAKMRDNEAFVLRRRQADKLRAVAEWFTDCKNLNIEKLPKGLIDALNAGADALLAQSGALRVREEGRSDD